jgi:hypothetical protein
MDNNTLEKMIFFKVDANLSSCTLKWVVVEEEEGEEEDEEAEEEWQ